jgi:hypothetical protein
MIYGLIAVTAVLFLVLGLHEREREAWQTERGQLIDRIQAHSLSEYKAFQPDEKGTEDEKKQEDEPEYVR